MSSPFAYIAIIPVRVYQRFISPLFAPRCRYYPTCSSYALGALRTHGLVKGTLLAIWRILRCNPWSLGGVDEVPARGKWTSEAWTPPQDWAGYDDPWAQTPMGMDRTDDKTSVDTLEDFSAKAEHHADAVSAPRAS